MQDKKIVLLIDAENTSAKFADGIMQYLTKQGDIISAQIYGDFLDNKNTKQWNSKAVQYNLQRYQADTTKAGKNAADIALVIDAMDFLHKENHADVFCVITSDGDFTRLVERIRKENIEVIGMGKTDASPRLRRACSEYVELEQLNAKSKSADNNLADKEKKKQPPKVVKQSEKTNASGKKSTRKKVPLNQIKMALNELVQNDENAGKAPDLGGIKSRIQLRYPGFDEKDYGYSSIRELIDKETKFSVHQDGTHAIVVSDKKEQEDNELELVCRFMIDQYPNKVIGQHEIGALGRKLKNQYPNFQYKQYGYKKLSTFLEDVGFHVY
ncbi:MAG: NYN domain-containing protein [Lachnospiraceae bacterium]|nr:NYN domain-containing protein [Lachnospiraceae bacterium]HCJ07817.1 hypothetical protein [Lachnospiraceae bacterium]